MPAAYYFPNRPPSPGRPKVPVRYLYEPETTEFITRSGATSSYGATNDFIAWLKREGLWARFLVVPCKAASNKGSGAVVSSFGGLRHAGTGAGDLALINAPVWNPNGLLFANTKYATAAVPAVRQSTNFWSWRRRVLSVPIASNSPEGPEIMIGHSGSAPGESKSWARGGSTGLWTTDTANVLLSLTTPTAPTVGTTHMTGAIARESTVVWRAGTAGRINLYDDLTAVELDLLSNYTPGVTNMSPAGCGFTTDDVVYFNARRSAGVISSGTSSVTSVAYAIYDGSDRDLTDPERIAITNYINAL